MNGQDIPGAPEHFKHLLDRIQSMLDAQAAKQELRERMRDERINRTIGALTVEVNSLKADVADAIRYGRGINTKIGLIEDRLNSVEDETRGFRRSITPAPGIPSTQPPDEVA